MSWKHRKSGTTHEWWYEEARDILGMYVYSTAVVFSGDSSEDSSANWEVLRDGSPIARGHASTVRQAKKDAFKALWKPRQGQFARLRNYERRTGLRGHRSR
jgi:hypothetical protein